jgi:sugar phosphate isomerase/epimerase
MQYGAMNFPVKPLLEEIDKISALGFDYLELTMDPPQTHYKQVERQKKEIRKALNDYHLGLVCHLPTFVYTADLTESLRKASLEEVFGSLEVAADLNPLKIVLHPSYIGGLSTFVIDQAAQLALQSLEAILEKSAQLGLFVCLENMFPRYHNLVNPQDFIAIFKRFPTLKLTLDTGHANIGSPGGKKILDFIHTFTDRIGHVHASDNFGKEDNHLPLGTGTIHFPEVIKALKKTGYDETITFEIFSQEKDYLRISRDKFAEMLASD